MLYDTVDGHTGTLTTVQSRIEHLEYLTASFIRQQEVLGVRLSVRTFHLLLVTIRSVTNALIILIFLIQKLRKGFLNRQKEDLHKMSLLALERRKNFLARLKVTDSL